MKRVLPQSRSGQSLVEFAVVALVMYMLLAAIVTFGHMLYVAQGLQSAADLAAREISRTPLPADMLSLEEALENETVKSTIYDPAYLVIDLDVFYGNSPDGNVLRDIFDGAPLLNQQLAMVMIVDRPVIGDTQRWFLRYPGALLQSSPPLVHPMTASGEDYDDAVVTGFTVGIPLVLNRGPDGVETIRWVKPVEEIADGSGLMPFDINHPDKRGIVAIRINYPVQSAAMSSFRHDPTDPEFPFEPTVGRPNAADDGGVVQLNDAPGVLTDSQLRNGPLYAGTYGGKFGLGAQGALGSEQLTGGRPVRPYRRVISAQAIYRREMFSAPSLADPDPDPPSP